MSRNSCSWENFCDWDAAKIYESYLTAFPSGRRWQEASYWAARSRLSLGDTAKARALVDMNQRIPLYQQAEEIILDECPWICTYHVRNVVLLRKQVTGIREKVTPLDTGTEFPQVDFAFVDIED